MGRALGRKLVFAGLILTLFPVAPARAALNLTVFVPSSGVAPFTVDLLRLAISNASPTVISELENGVASSFGIISIGDMFEAEWPSETSTQRAG